MKAVYSNITIKSNIISSAKLTGPGDIQWYLPIDLLPAEYLENIRTLWHHLSSQQQEQANKKLFLATNLMSELRDDDSNKI